jgi:hypothetical protein
MSASTGTPATADTPRFTVLVPVYNHERYIGQALDSLLGQTFADWEAVVVDDGSTDGTPAVIEGYAARDGRFRVIHKPNGGVGTALNRGLHEARGDWVLWLSSDDLFAPRKLEQHQKVAAERPECRMHVTRFWNLEDATGIRTVSSPGSRFPKGSFAVLDLLRHNFIAGISICVDRRSWLAVGGFDETMRYGQDHDMWLRLLSEVPVCFLPERTCLSRQHPGQWTFKASLPMAYDLARGSVRFLGGRPLSRSVPGLDTAPRSRVRSALRSAFRTAADPGSCMYGLGPHALLLLRLLEWTRTPAGQGHRVFVSRLIARWAERVTALAPGTALALQWRALAAVPADSLDNVNVEEAASWGLGLQTWKRIQARRGDEAEALERYLTGLKHPPEPGDAGNPRSGHWAVVETGFAEMDAARTVHRHTVVEAAHAVGADGGLIAVVRGPEGVSWVGDTLVVSLPSVAALRSFLGRLGAAKTDDLAEPEAGPVRLVEIPGLRAGRGARTAVAAGRRWSSLRDAGLQTIWRLRYAGSVAAQTPVTRWPAQARRVWAVHKHHHP